MTEQHFGVAPCNCARFEFLGEESPIGGMCRESWDVTPWDAAQAVSRFCQTVHLCCGHGVILTLQRTRRQDD